MPIETQTSHTEQLTEQPQVAEYEAPRVESILTSDELEREVAYAGGTLPSGLHTL